jgi:endoglucanase
MQHFSSEGFNAYRLPTGWQFLTNNDNTPTSTLDPTTFGKYDILVQACLSTSALCIIDIHNYARFNGQTIGTGGGPSNAVFAALWANIATKYVNSNVAFGIVNEPHDLDMSTWVGTVQAVVTAIRGAGATKQLILMPGTSYTSAEYLVSSGYADALSVVTNPDGSKTGLVYDVHKYLDSDGSGSGGDCVDSYISSAFDPLAQWLRSHGRQAFLTEIGGIESSNCYNYVCQAIQFLNANSDVYLGYVGWAAGSFDVNYVLSEVPNNGVDQQLVTKCLKP